MIIKETIKNKNTNTKIIKNISPEDFKSTLSKILYNDFSLLKLWRYHNLFLKLKEEQYRDDPVIISGLSMIYMMIGDLNKVNELKSLLPKNSIYSQYVDIVDPLTSNEEFIELINKQIELNILPSSHLSLTAGRPSVLNGFRDMSSLFKDIKKNKKEVIKVLNVLYGTDSELVYNLMLAEQLYQKNECYEALVLVISVIPKFEEKHDVRMLFVALYLEIMILVMNGQVKSINNLMNNLILKTKTRNMEEWLPNIKALEAWAAMYDGDYIKIAEWMDSYAPDEYNDFNMMDTFRYFVKIRGYLINQKYLLITSLANKLLPLLKEDNRKMDECELLMLLALSDYAREDYESAFNNIEKALNISKLYNYDRLLADEGEKICRLLLDYRKQKGKDKYLDKVISLSQQVLALYPNYLKDQLPKEPSLTVNEMGVLRLINDGRSNSEISELLTISLNTVKYYTKSIFKKLNVKNRQQALKVAKDYGLL